MKTFHLVLTIFVWISVFSLGAAALDGQGKQENFKDDYWAWKNRPHDKFNDGEKMFELVKETLMKKYQNANITEDDIYRAAVEGMLSNIGHLSWDKLLSPTEVIEMKNDLDGEIVGIGIELKYDPDSGTADILGVIAGTPSEKVGLKAGDKILKVNGKSYKGQQFRDMVYDIRGQAGETVHLTLLRDDKIISKDVRREKVTWDTVRSETLDHNVGVITINYFSSKTPQLLKESLERLKTKNIKALVLDLRQNDGGYFDGMIQSAELFVPAGQVILTTVKRGGVEEPVISKGSSLLGKNIPVEVLVNGETSSSAEMLAGSLKENIGAKIIGQKTKGKWSAQSLEELPNKYAIKYTVSFFKTPQGEELDGKGLEPDVVVDFDGDKVEKARRLMSETERLKTDVQLRTALNLVK